MASRRTAQSPGGMSADTGADTGVGEAQPGVIADTPLSALAARRRRSTERWLEIGQLVRATNDRRAVPALAVFALSLFVLASLVPGNHEHDIQRNCGVTPRPGSNADFCVMSTADLREQHLDGWSARSANLSAAILSGAALRHADLAYAQLDAADLSLSDLRGARMHGASLRGANLGHARLQDADLRQADLSGARVRGAVWDGALLDQATWIDGQVCGSGSVGYCRSAAVQPASASGREWVVR